MPRKIPFYARLKTRGVLRNCSPFTLCCCSCTPKSSPISLGLPFPHLLVMFVLSCMCGAEAAARSTRQAQAEDLDKVDIEHVEKVLPQLLLDF
uniref:Uncharacterized protein n=1 Tax=Gopherus agassizii TaxID=38772 RepID=A0A452ICW1_9SAUR